jgi:hypothetical protein
MPYVRSIAWNGTMWLAGGGDINTNAYALAMSTDGENWTQIIDGNNVLTFLIASIAWNGNCWIIGSAYGYVNIIASSVDALNWTASVNGDELAFYCTGIAARRLLPNVGSNMFGMNTGGPTGPTGADSTVTGPTGDTGARGLAFFYGTTGDFTGPVGPAQIGDLLLDTTTGELYIKTS